MPATVSLDGFNAECRLAPKTIVFSHGFGVDRTDRGLFSDVAAGLVDDFGFVMFDYYDREGDEVSLSDFSEWQRRLKAVLLWTADQKSTSEIYIIGHSMGCIVATLAKPENISKTLFLAPPISIGERTRDYFTSRPGASKKAGVWRVPRRDGTVSIIPESLFDEFEAVNATESLARYSRENPTSIVSAGADEVLDSTDYSQLVAADLLKIDGANHDFSGDSRSEIIDLIRHQLLD